MPPSVEVIDSHLHLWDPTLLHYAWLDQVPDLRRPFLPIDLDAEGAGADGIVVVQADCRPTESTAEVRWLQALARQWPAISGIVAHAPVETGASCRDTVDALSAESLVVGVRRLIQDEPPGFAVAPNFVDGVRLLGQYGLVFDVCVRQHQLREAAELARRCPDVTFVLDHLGKPRVTSSPSGAWLRDLAALGTVPNVRCKLSGLASEARDGSLDPVVFRPYLQHAIDVFGPARCLFGSDWPVSTIAISYPAWLAAVRDAISDLPAGDQHQVLRATAASVYGLPARSAGEVASTKVPTGASTC